MHSAAIVNYNMGNLASMENSISKVGHKGAVVANADELSKFDRLVLPGVGAFPDAMEHLKNSGMDEAVREFVKSGKPVLGVCLGMQLLFEKGYEHNECDGLGILKGEVVRFDEKRLSREQKVPHMGWNRLWAKKKSPLLGALDDGFYLYFVHSYHVVCDSSITVATARYGYDFAAVVQSDNVYGIQPHPEKSGDNGLAILKNFLEL